jgi:hypothetical protein
MTYCLSVHTRMNPTILNLSFFFSVLSAYNNIAELRTISIQISVSLLLTLTVCFFLGEILTD